MTEGFDAATPQAGLNFPAAVAAGREFVFVKAAGGNVGLYVAPHYADELDAARAAGLHVGHTFLTGKAASSSASATYFVQNLRHFNLSRDGLALDNERFPDEPGSQMWNDTQVAEFWAQVFHLLPTLPRTRAYTYGGEAAMTALGPWTKTAKTGAVRAWCAAYGPDDGHRHTTPTVPGLTVAIHQYTSRGSLGGRTVDLDWSPLTLTALFPPIPLPAPVPAPVPAAATSPIEEDPMPIYFKGDQTSSVYVYNALTGTKRHITHPEYTVVVGSGVTVVHVAQADADAIPAG